MLGIGTYGEVRYAFHPPSSQHVAVKLIDLSRASAGSVRDSISSECAMMKTVNSPHCVRLIEVKQQLQHSGTWCSQCACSSLALNPHSQASPSDLSVSPSSPLCRHCSHSASQHSALSSRPVTLLAQELGIGGELFSLLSHTGPLSEPLARHYFQQLIAGVSACHRANVIHRDLKPENLILDAEFELKIVDYGLSAMRKEPRPVAARPAAADDDDEVDDDFDYAAYAAAAAASPLDAGDDGTCIHHTGVGSAPYSAPEAYYRELHSYRPYKGAPADIWSCGVILYVLLTGRPPFSRPLTRSFGSLRRDRHFVALMKGEYDASIGDEAKELLSGLLRVHPDDRWTLDEIRRSRWWRGERLGRDQVVSEMKRRSEETYRRTDRQHMIALLHALRKERAAPSPPPHRSHAALSPSARRHGQREQAASSAAAAIACDAGAVTVGAAEGMARELSGLQLGAYGELPQHQLHTSVLPPPLHERHQQQHQPAPPLRPLAAVTASSSAAAYQSYFRSARPPSHQPLSLTAQNSLKPTRWVREESGSLSHTESGGGGEEVDDDDDEEEGEEEPLPAEDVDAGYEVDSDSTSEDMEAERQQTGHSEQQQQPQRQQQGDRKAAEEKQQANDAKHREDRQQ